METSEAHSVAEQWVRQLETWIEGHGLRGYDPFDAKAHPAVRALQPYMPLRKASSLLLDLFPRASRRLLGVKRTLNPKAVALVALGRLRLFQLSGESKYLAQARQDLEWLIQNPSTGFAGLCWGYPFDVSGKSINRPAGTPVGVVTAVAGEAFALAYEITREQVFLDATTRIAAFFNKALHRIVQTDGTFCFSYTPLDRWPVHNANLHAVAHLFRTAVFTGDDSLRNAAEPALQFSLRHQRPDGAWLYGEWAPDCGYEKSLLDTIDHHHTGFVLRSLAEIHALSDRSDVLDVIRRGFEFYRRHLFTDAGVPQITVQSTYPVNIHACTEGILCPAVLKRLIPDAWELGARTLLWTRCNMADPETGLPFYRKYPFFTNRMLFPRWGLAWTFYALCEYLYCEARH